MKLSKLLRKDIEPRCTYCAHGSPLADGKRIACRKRGVMDAQSNRKPTLKKMAKTRPSEM